MKTQTLRFTTQALLATVCVLSLTLAHSPAFAFGGLSNTNSAIKETCNNHLHNNPIEGLQKVAIQIDQGERKCKDINGEWTYDCRTTFVRNIINKGKECGHQGSNKEIYEDYKKKAYQAYSFGGFELHGYKNGKKLIIPADCTGFAPEKGVVAGATHCFKDNDLQKISDLAKKGKIYYKYINKHGRTTRVELDVYTTKEVGPRNKGFVLFRTKSEVQRDHFMKLPPRGTTHDELQSIINTKKIMEVASQVNKDWTKTLKDKRNKKPRRQLHSKCSPGSIDSNTYSMPMVAHACDTFLGSSGAPLLTEVNLCTPTVLPPMLLGIHTGFESSDNLAASMSGSNLEEIYKFIDSNSPSLPDKVSSLKPKKKKKI